MAEHTKHHHKKNVIKLLSITLAVVVLALVLILFFKSDFGQDKIALAMGDNAAIQKSEYKKQQSIAREKYGVYHEASSSSKTKKASSKSASSSSKLSSSSSASSSASASSSSAQSQSDYSTYTVKSGDYLSTIASKYHTTTSTLMDLNDLDSATISEGQVLKVPATSASNASSASSDAGSSSTDKN
ncbi:LysM repeat-containing protein [Ligilactobacillus sp. WC1T17]|uniref:LysM repeat-containing protein n=1 Tax=Ligilactobacillus ruminis TaxID=1623 RepID=A0ABY1ABU0_9LACO|nr:LysM repeat-containing protein [Ligilactobacillus ruminis]